MSKRQFRGTKLSGPGMQPRFRTRKQGPSNKTLNKKIKRIQSKDELRHKDTAFAAQTVSTTAAFYALNIIGQGDSEILRDGNEIDCTSVQWRLSFESDVDSFAAVNVRMIVFWDAQCNGADPTVGNLLQSTVITSVIHAPYNHNFQKRFKIVQDQVITLTPQIISDFDPATGTTTTVGIVSRYNKGKRALSRITKYSSTASDITGIASNSLFVMFVSDTGAELPTVDGGFRVYFKEP